MANAALDLTTIRVHQDFAAIANEKVALQTEPARDWDDNYFGMIPIWGGLALDDNTLKTYGAEFFKELADGRISTTTAIKGLRMSLSLASMNPANPNRLIIEPQRPVVATENMLAHESIIDLTLFSSHSFYITAQQTMGGQVNISSDTTVVALGAEGQQQTPEVDSDSELRTSYAFLAVYLMKLLVKNPRTVLLGLTNMKRRYNAFYGPSRFISEFSCTLVQLTAYRDALASQSHIMTSYTVAIAHTHQNTYARLNQQEQGVLSYLCFLPFSYTGMHAYTMMVELRGASNIGLDILLTMFFSDITAPALRKIADVIRLKERTVSHPDRSVIFRYCAPWGAHYFAEMRSKHCTHLIYTLAHTWSNLKETSEYSDPTKIAAVETLSDYMKKTLRKAGIIIANTIRNSMLKGAGASQAFQMAIDAPDESEEEDEDMDWDKLARVPTQL